MPWIFSNSPQRRKGLTVGLSGIDASLSQRKDNSMTAPADISAWKAIGLLVDQNTRDLLEERYGIFPEVVSWFKVVRLFRQTENERMIERQPAAGDLESHRSQLELLIREGVRLLEIIHDHGEWPENPAGIRVEDIAAGVEDLRITQREWHEPLSAARKRELWRGVFNVTASGS
jgi:hypothetical protein